MHPELEFFLESAFESVQPTSTQIGRAVLEPDYDAIPSDGDAASLAHELVECLREQSPAPAALKSRDGAEVRIAGKYPLLSKYIRRITLHDNRLEGSWVEIAPPGNWI